MRARNSKYLKWRSSNIYAFRALRLLPLQLQYKTVQYMKNCAKKLKNQNARENPIAKPFGLRLASCCLLLLKVNNCYSNTFKLLNKSENSQKHLFDKILQSWHKILKFWIEKWIDKNSRKHKILQFLNKMMVKQF